MLPLHSCNSGNTPLPFCTTFPRLQNVASPPFGSFVQLSLASDGHACALRSNGSAVCWGALGGPQGGEHSSPGPYVQIATTAHFTCAIRVDGSLQCWGEYPRVWSQSSPSFAPPAGMRFLEISAQ